MCTENQPKLLCAVYIVFYFCQSKKEKEISFHIHLFASYYIYVDLNTGVRSADKELKYPSSILDNELRACTVEIILKDIPFILKNCGASVALRITIQ